MVVVALLFLRVASIVDANLLVRVVQLPVLVLILLVKVDHEQRMLEVDKEVPHVSHLLWLLLVRDDVEVGVSVLVRSVDFLLQLLLIVAEGDILHTKVGAQVHALLDKVNADWIALTPIRLVRAASILRSRCALRKALVRFLVRIWRLWIEMVWELVVTIVWPHDLVRASGGAKAQGSLSDRDVKCTDQTW